MSIQAYQNTAKKTEGPRQTEYRAFAAATRALIDAASLSGNVASGNIVGALVDVAGLAYDVTATAVPGLPAGAGALIQAGRAADDVAGAVARNAGDAGEGTIVSVSRSRHPEAASHIERAQAAGHPRTLTVDRAGATANRAEAMRGTPPRAGSDRDEYPPAMFKEGGSGSSVERINPSDNRGAGASVGRQCRSVPNGERVTIAVCD